MNDKRQNECFWLWIVHFSWFTRSVLLPAAVVEFRDIRFSLCGLPASLKSIQIQWSIIGITCQPKLADNDGGLVDGYYTSRQWSYYRPDVNICHEPVRWQIKLTTAFLLFMYYIQIDQWLKWKRSNLTHLLIVL